jgi:hypothetical protein
LFIFAQRPRPAADGERNDGQNKQEATSNKIGTMGDDKAEPLRSDSPVHVVMVDVTAPATLPAGYEFEAQVEGDPERTVHAVVVRIVLWRISP